MHFQLSPVQSSPCSVPDDHVHVHISFIRSSAPVEASEPPDVQWPLASCQQWHLQRAGSGSAVQLG